MDVRCWAYVRGFAAKEWSASPIGMYSPDFS